MYPYKRVITTPSAIEIEYYWSIRPVGKKFAGRGINKNLSPEKQKKANQIRTMKKWTRIIDCNFCSDDYWCRFSAPFGTFTNEQYFRKEVSNWIKRIKRRCDKQNIELKYIGFIECGKLGKNWHIHIILSKSVRQIAYDCWHYQDGGCNFTPLWHNGNYQALAKYIRKDITEPDAPEYETAKKRMMASRNLTRPKETVKPATKKELKKLSRGNVVDAPKGYVYVEDEFEKYVSDVTGAKYYFKFRRIEQQNSKRKPA